MDALGLTLGLALPALFVALVVHVARTVSATLGRRGEDPVVRGARRRTAGATAAAGLAVVVVLAVTTDPTPGANPLVGSVAVLLVGAVMAATATLVELTWPRPRGSVRTAPARPRPDVGPRLRRLRHGGALVLVALCALTAVLGATEGVDHGRRMPDLTAFRMVGDGLFPGWPYGLGLLVALGVLGLVTQWGLRVVEARPSLDEQHATVDAAARRAATARLLRYAACSTWLAVLGVAFVAGSSLHEYAQGLRGSGSPSAHHPPLDWRQDLAFGLFALGVLAGVLAFVSAVTSPTPHVTASSSGRRPGTGTVLRATSSTSPDPSR
ncbi:hypothetical protein [Phycicoccus sonneratiae]|uniref:DUF1206 domain-containing protein n=1 Tax=Phycicoccus sonneratiae TaxID=2807628 RepID=A0ABS2CRE5_9MICO|nr:hypothetical protein [Phycicoccus sonneraticus]MBM6402355.1 hypothetical protein [Phycicoccus sonneraticus]